MLSSMRRVVTGDNEQGRSQVSMDGPPSMILEAEGQGVAELWQSDQIPPDLFETADPALREPVLLEPSAGGVKFRYFLVPPQPREIPPEQHAAMEVATAEAFKQAGAEHCLVDTTKHPAMHKTDSLDFIVLLRGNVTLLLDEEDVDLKQGDVVVQRATNHAWANYGDEPALMIAVLIDSEGK